jgi:hypothetical protein
VKSCLCGAGFLAAKIDGLRACRDEVSRLNQIDILRSRFLPA